MTLRKDEEGISHSLIGKTIDLQLYIVGSSPTVRVMTCQRH